MILFLFLTHLGLGIIFTLVVVSREAGVKFFRFNAGLAAALIAVAFAFRPSADPTAAGQVALIALALSESAIVLYWATIGRALASIRPAVVAVACCSGIVALVAQAMEVTPGGTLDFKVLTVASFLSSTALLGGASTAMILGHWYLVIPSMQVSHLQSIVKVHIASMVVRVVVVVAAVVVAIETWEPGLGPSFKHYIMSVCRHILLAARPVWPWWPGAAVLPDLGNREDPVHTVGDRHSLRGLLHRGRRRGAREVSAARDPSAGVVHCTVCGLHRGPEPVQFQPTNRVRAGRQQR